MVKEFLPTLMEIGTKENGKKIKKMIRVCLLGRMATCMKGSTKTIFAMGLEFITMLMEIYTKEIGEKIKNMARACIL